jgi:hypothetical protein
MSWEDSSILFSATFPWRVSPFDNLSSQAGSLGKTNTEAGPRCSSGASLARSQTSKAQRGRTRLLAYSIPLIALVGTAVVYGLTVAPASSPAAMDYTFQLLIEVTNKNVTNPMVRAIAPSNAIGIAGGSWASTQYNAYGVDQAHYPIYMDVPGIACAQAVCTIHVKSKVVHQYYLGDFFSVWGQTIGQNNTISITRSGNFAWQMCLGAAGNAVSSDLWGALPLRSQLLPITLDYYDTANGLGCAPS